MKRYYVTTAYEEYYACRACATHFLALNPSAYASPVTLPAEDAACDLHYDYDGRVTCEEVHHA